MSSYLESDISPIAGLSDAGALVVKKGGANAGFVNAARRQSQRARPLDHELGWELLVNAANASQFWPDFYNTERLDLDEVA